MVQLPLQSYIAREQGLQVLITTCLREPGGGSNPGTFGPFGGARSGTSTQTPPHTAASPRLREKWCWTCSNFQRLALYNYDSQGVVQACQLICPAPNFVILSPYGVHLFFRVLTVHTGYGCLRHMLPG